MAETLRTSKRKSTASTERTSKKAKVVKPADTPAPLKSALKKPKQPITTKASTRTATTAKKSRKADLPTQATTDDEDENDNTLTSDQTAALLAGFSSSDEEEDEDDGLALDKLPNPPKIGDSADSIALNTANKAEADGESTPGAIYIGRLPHGFYERQMRAYFSQFGTITHLKMGRNKKTGRSKHYAFVEFASAAVADIVTKTMDKYLLFNHILRVQRVPTEHIKEGMWKGEGKRKRPMPMNKIEGAKLRKGTDADGWKKRIDRENARRQSKAKKMEELGYSFVMTKVKSITDLPALDTPTLEKEAEKQLLEDVKNVADVQSSEVELQPESVEEPVEKVKKQSKKQAVPSSTESASVKNKKRSTSIPAEKKTSKRSKTVR